MTTNRFNHLETAIAYDESMDLARSEAEVADYILQKEIRDRSENGLCVYCGTSSRHNVCDECAAALDEDFDCPF